MIRQIRDANEHVETDFYFKGIFDNICSPFSCPAFFFSINVGEFRVLDGIEAVLPPKSNMGRAEIFFTLPKRSISCQKKSKELRRHVERRVKDQKGQETAETYKRRILTFGA